MKNKELIERIELFRDYNAENHKYCELADDCKQTIIQQQEEIERLNNRMDQMCKEYQSIVDEKVDENERLKKVITDDIKEIDEMRSYYRSEINRLKSDDFQLQRLWDWMQEENREPAQTKFTAGLLRNIAKEIEFLKNKQEEREIELVRWVYDIAHQIIKPTKLRAKEILNQFNKR